tara:strand:- start:65 stop:274 length:210 start_codon:yes stop_codon:yes gene_type:complete
MNNRLDMQCHNGMSWALVFVRVAVRLEKTSPILRVETVLAAVVAPEVPVSLDTYSVSSADMSGKIRNLK